MFGSNTANSQKMPLKSLKHRLWGRIDLGNKLFAFHIFSVCLQSVIKLFYLFLLNLFVLLQMRIDGSRNARIGRMPCL